MKQQECPVFSTLNHFDNEDSILKLLSQIGSTPENVDQNLNCLITSDESKYYPDRSQNDFKKTSRLPKSSASSSSSICRKTTLFKYYKSTKKVSKSRSKNEKFVSLKNVDSGVNDVFHEENVQGCARTRLWKNCIEKISENEKNKEKVIKNGPTCQKVKRKLGFDVLDSDNKCGKKKIKSSRKSGRKSSGTGKNRKYCFSLDSWLKFGKLHISENNREEMKGCNSHRDQRVALKAVVKSNNSSEISFKTKSRRCGKYKYKSRNKVKCFKEKNEKSDNKSHKNILNETFTQNKTKDDDDVLRKVISNDTKCASQKLTHSDGIINKHKPQKNLYSSEGFCESFEPRSTATSNLETCKNVGEFKIPPSPGPRRLAKKEEPELSPNSYVMNVCGPEAAQLVKKLLRGDALEAVELKRGDLEERLAKTLEIFEDDVMEAELAEADLPAENRTDFFTLMSLENLVERANSQIRQKKEENRDNEEVDKNHKDASLPEDQTLSNIIKDIEEHVQANSSARNQKGLIETKDNSSRKTDTIVNLDRNKVDEESAVERSKSNAPSGEDAFLQKLLVQNFEDILMDNYEAELAALKLSSNIVPSQTNRAFNTIEHREDRFQINNPFFSCTSNQQLSDQNSAFPPSTLNDQNTLKNNNKSELESQINQNINNRIFLDQKLEAFFYEDPFLRKILTQPSEDILDNKNESEPEVTKLTLNLGQSRTDEDYSKIRHCEDTEEITVRSQMNSQPFNNYKPNRKFLDQKSKVIVCEDAFLQKIHTQNIENILEDECETEAALEPSPNVGRSQPNQEIDTFKPVAEENIPNSQFSTGNSYRKAKKTYNLTEDCILHGDNLLKSLLEERRCFWRKSQQKNFLRKRIDETKVDESKIFIKRYRKHGIRIYKIKKLLKVATNEDVDSCYRPPEDQILNAFLKNLDGSSENRSSRSTTSRKNCDSVSTPVSYQTDETRTETLSTGSSKLTQAQKLLRRGINKLSRDKTLLFSKVEDAVAKDFDKHKIWVNVDRIVNEVLDQYERGLNPVFWIPKENITNCFFANGRYQLKRCPDYAAVSFGVAQSRQKFNLILYLLTKIKSLLETDTKLTKREIYYQLKMMIASQCTTDRALKEIGRMLRVGLWALNVTAQKGMVYGNLKLVMDDGQVLNCNVPGTLIPPDVSKICEIQSTAYFILVVEKESIFYKLLEENLPVRLTRPFILITGKGFPDLNTQLFLKKLWMVMSIPVFILVDADPDGIAIMLNYRFGSIANAHVSEHLAIPKARWLGVFPSEISRLSLCHETLSKREVSVTRKLIQLECVKENKKIKTELEKLLRINFKTGIEALIKNDTYLSNCYLNYKFYTNDLI